MQCNVYCVMFCYVLVCYVMQCDFMCVFVYVCMHVCMWYTHTPQLTECHCFTVLTVLCRFIPGGRWDLALHILEDARSMGPFLKCVMNVLQNDAAGEGSLTWALFRRFKVFKGWIHRTVFECF